MIEKRLAANLDTLRQEYLLVQAWKKTASYIRAHSWYADTLDLDKKSVNLRSFIAELQEMLENPHEWANDAIRMVPAPKSQEWHIIKNGNGGQDWKPIDSEAIRGKFRPLAYVSAKDQVLATAIALCLADRIETEQGNPAHDVSDKYRRQEMISYGNRLLCDQQNRAKKLVHRWGSSGFYRSYFTDYRTFLSRPDMVAESFVRHGEQVVIVHSDIKQFYDRVTPKLFSKQLRSIQNDSDDQKFFDFAKKIFYWEWDHRDKDLVKDYQEATKLNDFSRVVLPQGLVASGFFSNLALSELDRILKKSIHKEISRGLILEDACRYVDDIRFVIRATTQNTDLMAVEGIVCEWFEKLLDRHARGLKPNREKTIAVEFRGNRRPLIRQSRSMERIQKAVSGGFDALGGVEILDAVQGLIRTQERFANANDSSFNWRFAPVPDVRDATVARFAAGRFRATYRSLRPLLEPINRPAIESESGNDEDPPFYPREVVRSQGELDDDANAFALGLVGRWIEDPSNIRLLRVGLDLWPSREILEEVLGLLRSSIKVRSNSTEKRIAWYCLAELFRAGATETGFVPDAEVLPSILDIQDYRDLLQREAKSVIEDAKLAVPWYVLQQAMLYLATCSVDDYDSSFPQKCFEVRSYRTFLRFLTKQTGRMTKRSFATCAVMARKSYLDRDKALGLISSSISKERLIEIANMDRSFANEILDEHAELIKDLPSYLQRDLCRSPTVLNNNMISLSKFVIDVDGLGRLRNELSLLRFASRFLGEFAELDFCEAITPNEVFIKLSDSDDSPADITDFHMEVIKASGLDSIYSLPTWCSGKERWRFHLGFLMRFILTGDVDFTRTVKRFPWKESEKCYRTPEGSWYQRIYGLFNGHRAFGDDWLPISDWIEEFLFFLLSWPGCHRSRLHKSIGSNMHKAIRIIDERICRLEEMRGRATGLLMLPIRTCAPVLVRKKPRTLRICVLQTVRPSPKICLIPGRTQSDFDPVDLKFDDLARRRWHRYHLSSALAAVERMLHLRDTHRNRNDQLDFLILPELAVHPDDVYTHLIPFARAHRALILAGLTYAEYFPGEPLINSAIWIIPTLSPTNGLQVTMRIQGKQNLAPIEENFNNGSILVKGFRPAQWLIGYEWSEKKKRPLQLTGSICYDATDLGLAEDLKRQSDVFAIPALNQDVGTFDHLAQALHYHMFQTVIVANNGTFGGSNAYTPYKDQFQRQIFHLHGQPQASMAFIEIENIAEFIKRADIGRRETMDGFNKKSDGKSKSPSWKCPPSGFGKVS